MQEPHSGGWCALVVGPVPVVERWRPLKLTRGHCSSSLAQLSRTSDLPILALALRLVFNLFSHLKVRGLYAAGQMHSLNSTVNAPTCQRHHASPHIASRQAHLKVQLEVFFTSVHLFLADSRGCVCPGPDNLFALLDTHLVVAALPSLLQPRVSGAARARSREPRRVLPVLAVGH